jgi:hypothetical protein
MTVFHVKLRFVYSLIVVLNTHLRVVYNSFFRTVGHRIVKRKVWNRTLSALLRDVFGWSTTGSRG